MPCYKMGILLIYNMSVMLWAVTYFCTYYNNKKLTYKYRLFYGMILMPTL